MSQDKNHTAPDTSSSSYLNSYIGNSFLPSNTFLESD